MNCEQALQKLSEYLDRELDLETSETVAQHLAACRQCFSRAEFERRLRQLVRRSSEGEQAPPELQERLRRLLRLF